MKFAVIQIHEKHEKIKRDFALTDENPATSFEKDGDSLILQPNCYCTLAEEPIRFMSVKDVMEEYLRQNVIWLQNPELVKQMEKCIASFVKLDSKVNDATYEKSQQQIEWGIRSLGIPVEESDDEIDPFSGGRRYLSASEWTPVCKTAYQYALSLKNKEDIYTALHRDGFRESYYQEIADVYTDYISGVHDKAFCEKSMRELKQKYVK